MDQTRRWRGPRARYLGGWGGSWPFFAAALPHLVADWGLTGLLMKSRVAFVSVLPGTTPGLPSPPHPINDTTTVTEPTAARTALIKPLRFEFMEAGQGPDQT